MKRRKRKKKNRRLEDIIRNHIDGLLTQQDLETPSKRKKLVKKQLTFSIGLESSNHQLQRKRKKEAENQVKNNTGLSPEELEMLESLTKRN